MDPLRRPRAHRLGPAAAALSLVAACGVTGGDGGGPGDAGLTAGATSHGTGGDEVGTGGAGDDAPPTTGGGTAGSDGMTVFHVGSGDDTPPVSCPEPTEMMGDSDVVGSYIWVSNSDQGTLSKIDTETLVEEGRYAIGPESYDDPVNGITHYDADPSRTSVSPAGNAAVGDRHGGVVKVIAVPENCPDVDDDGMITTSTGKDDVLPWGEDECVVWSWTGGDDDLWWVRGLGWTPEPVWNPHACVWEYELWVAAPTSDGAKVFLLSGHDGSEKAEVPIPDFDDSTFMDFYGGAVDADGNFWTHEKGQCMCFTGNDILDEVTEAECNGVGDWQCPRLAYVSHEALQPKTWEYPVYGYGITIDSVGHVWVCSHEVGRFDPATETWATAFTGGNGGCMADGSGRVWQAGSPLRAVDIETLDVVTTGSIPYGAHGVSVDDKGRVWGVPVGGGDTDGRVDRYDPATDSFESYTGLFHPYTYSDMTGVALLNAGSIPVDPEG